MDVKKTSKAATFTYEENAAGNIVITGLTDKGRADAKVIVPAKIDGKKVDGIGSGVFVMIRLLLMLLYQMG